jgi:hypothetical protein
MIGATWENVWMHKQHGQQKLFVWYAASFSIFWKQKYLARV